MVEEILGGGDAVQEGVRSVATDERIRILAGGKLHHFDGEALGEQREQRAGGCLLAGFVGVETQEHGFDKTPQQPGLVAGKGGSLRCDDIPHAGFVG